MTRVDLTQEQIDRMASRLEDVGIRDVTVLETLADLPDIEHGRGELPENPLIVCQKCDSEIWSDDMMGTAYGSLYHEKCVPSLEEGPLPLAQYLAGVTDETRGPQA